MNLRYFILFFFINNCSGCNNNDNEKNKQEKPIPIKPIKIIHTQDISNIIPDIKLYIEGKKSLLDIQNEISKLKDIPDNQKKTLKDIKENLDNKDKLKKIIDNSNKLNSDITGTIQCKKNTEKIKLFCIRKDLNNINEEEILRNIKVFIDNKEINKDKISISDTGRIYCKIDNLKKKESLNISIEINNALMKKITNMWNMFCFTKYTTLNLSNLNTSKVTNMSDMFANCSNLKEIKGLDKWNTSNVTDMSYMFVNCDNLKEIQELEKWNTSKIKDISGMFAGCSKLVNIPTWYKKK